MREYIIYVMLIFIPIGMTMAYLLRKEGIAKRNIAIIVSVSAVIVVSFPVSMEKMGAFLSLLSYLIVILVMVRYLLAPREEYGLRPKGVLVTGPELDQLLADLDQNVYTAYPVVEAGNPAEVAPIYSDAGYDSLISYAGENFVESQDQPFDMRAEQDQEAGEESKATIIENQAVPLLNEPEGASQDVLAEEPPEYAEDQADIEEEAGQGAEEVIEEEETPADESGGLEVIEAAAPKIEEALFVEAETEEAAKAEEIEPAEAEEESLPHERPDHEQIEAPAIITAENQAEIEEEASQEAEEVIEEEETPADESGGLEVIEAAAPEIEEALFVEAETEEAAKAEEIEPAEAEEESLPHEQPDHEQIEAETEENEMIETEPVVRAEPEDLPINAEEAEVEVEQFIENIEPVTAEENLQATVMADSLAEESLPERDSPAQAGEVQESVPEPEIAVGQELILDGREEESEAFEYADVIEPEPVMPAIPGAAGDGYEAGAEPEDDMEIQFSGHLANEDQTSAEEPGAFEAEQIGTTSEIIELEAGVDELSEDDDLEYEYGVEPEEPVVAMIEPERPEETEIISDDIPAAQPESRPEEKVEERPMESTPVEEPVELEAGQPEATDAAEGEPFLVIDLQTGPPGEYEEDTAMAPAEAFEVGEGIEADSGENTVYDTWGETAARQEEQEPGEAEPLEVFEPDSEISFIDTDFSNIRIIELIDQGFSFKEQQNWPEAVRCFESAWDLTGDAELKYLIGVELTAIFEPPPAPFSGPEAPD